MLSIIVPTFRQPERLRLTLSNLLSACMHESVDGEVIVVDDDGDAGCRALVQSLASTNIAVRYLDGIRSGRSGARNRGAGVAVGSRLLFVDGDMILARGALEQHADLSLKGARVVARGRILRLPWLTAFQDPSVGICTPTAARTLSSASIALLEKRRLTLDEYGYPDATVARWARRNRFESDIQSWFSSASEKGRWLGLTGAHFSIPHDIFDELGGFDASMGHKWGAEDLELGFRIESSGIPIVPLDAEAYHMDHDTSGRQGDHRAAFEYLAYKHRRPELMRALDYFDGLCSFEEVASL